MKTTEVNVNRRQLLLAGSAVGSLALIGSYSQPTRANAAPSMQKALTAEPFYTTGSVFTPDFTSRVPFAVLLGVVVDGGATDLAGATLTVSFDERGQIWSGDDAVLQTKSTVALATTHSNAGSQGALTVTLPTKPGLETATVLFPLRPTRLYPADNVGPLGATTLHISGPGIDAILMTPVPDEEPSNGLAWGAELASSWIRAVDVRSAHGDSYAYPSEISITSVGPAPVPARSSVQVVVDRSIVASVSVAAVSVPAEAAPVPAWHFEPNATNGQSGGAIVLDEPLAAGLVLRIELDCEMNQSPAISDAITYARVSLAAPAEAQFMRRNTLMGSATAVTASGTPLVADAVRGKN